MVLTRAARAAALAAPDAFGQRLSGLPPRASTPMVVFLAGWPDDTRSFEKVVPAFERTHTVLCLSFPGNEPDKPLKNKWGYDFDALTSMMHEAIEGVRKAPRIQLVAHDWGAHLSLYYSEDHADVVDRHALLDIGVMKTHEFGVRECLFIPPYTLANAFAFVLNMVGLRILALLMYAVFPWKIIGPCPHEPVMPARANEFMRGYEGPAFETCYPYFYAWKRFLTGKMRKTRTPECPCLFIYALRKRAKYHADSFLEELDGRDDGSGTLALDCGHFMQCQKPDEVTAALLDFFK